MLMVLSNLRLREYIRDRMKLSLFLKKIVKRASRLCDEEFISKDKDDKGDLVTTADLGVEKYIIKEFKKKFPNFDIISEEFNPNKNLTENCLIIDPIDGTINFAHGLPLWGIQVALRMKGEMVASVLYFPRLREMYHADESGAFLNGKRIHVSNTPRDKALYLVEGGEKFAALTDLNVSNSRHWRYFCACCINHAWVAAGRLGGAILRKDNPWDYLPGQYLVQQAGGVVMNDDGAHVVANSKEMAEILFTKGRVVE